MEGANQELEEILVEIIRRSPGLGSGEIFQRSRFEGVKKTLQRRLTALVANGSLRREGKGRATRYYPPKIERLPVDKIELSSTSLESRRLVTRPVTERTPVGYDTEFLGSYTPNDTQYLPDSLRQKLSQIGQIGKTEQPAGTYLRQILDRLLIDLSWNSSRLEGNTYSLLDTQRLLKLGELSHEKEAEETQMLLNHKAAIELLAEQSSEIGFNRYTILNIHALLSENLLSDPLACGSLRDRLVGIGGSVFHPLALPQLIESQFDEFLQKADAITDPFEQAFFAMVHLPYLQPFEDVNKRVSRLAANIPFARHNLAPLSFVDVPREDYLHATIAVYEHNRFDYLRDIFAWAYQRSAANYTAVRQSLGKPDLFRMKYREEIGKLVRQNVLNTKPEPVLASVAEEDHSRIKEVVAIELASLHEGNIARYRLRPNEFTAWKKVEESAPS